MPQYAYQAVSEMRTSGDRKLTSFEHLDIANLANPVEPKTGQPARSNRSSARGAT